MQRVYGLAYHREESIRRRVMLAARYAPTDLKRSILEGGLRDPSRGVRENAFTSTLSLPSESALELLSMALRNQESRGVRRLAAERLGRLGDARAGRR